MQCIRRETKKDETMDNINRQRQERERKWGEKLIHGREEATGEEGGVRE